MLLKNFLLHQLALENLHRDKQDALNTAKSTAPSDLKEFFHTDIGRFLWVLYRHIPLEQSKQVLLFYPILVECTSQAS